MTKRCGCTPSINPMTHYRAWVVVVVVVVAS
jgi:hypothetical protein